VEPHNFLMIKLIQLIDPRLLFCEAEEKELPEECKVFEQGFEFLKARVEILNKKAAKYKVPPIEIIIVKEELIKIINPEFKKMQIFPTKELLDDPNSWVMVKQYTLTLKGEPPHIEGYEFIARLEHTPEGNFIYTNPKSSVPTLPAQFHTIGQHCDVCHTNRDRNDTFVIKMEKDDQDRFPDKKAGDMLIVGRNCLQRFMPDLTANGLIAWTIMIENMHEDVLAAEEMEDFEGGMGTGKYYEDSEHLLKYLVATYLHTGVYISKKLAQQNADAAASGGGPPGANTVSTLSRARTEMHPNLMASKNPEKDFPIRFRLKDDPEFVAKVEQMMKDFDEWLPTKNWSEMAQKKPEFADFFHNLQMVSKQEYLRGNHMGFFSALFQIFIRDKKDKEAKIEADKADAALPPSPIRFDDPTLIGKRLRDIAKDAEIKRLTISGMDEKAIKKTLRNKEWGWEVAVKKLVEYEKPQTFGYGDSNIGYRILFADDFGNDFMWFASSTLGMEEGKKYIIDGTLVGYEPPNKYHPNKSQIRINRVKIIKDLQNPNAPVAPVVAME